MVVPKKPHVGRGKDGKFLPPPPLEKDPERPDGIEANAIDIPDDISSDADDDDDSAMNNALVAELEVSIEVDGPFSRDHCKWSKPENTESWSPRCETG